MPEPGARGRRPPPRCDIRVRRPSRGPLEIRPGLLRFAASSTTVPPLPRHRGGAQPGAERPGVGPGRSEGFEALREAGVGEELVGRVQQAHLVAVVERGFRDRGGRLRERLEGRSGGSPASSPPRRISTRRHGFLFELGDDEPPRASGRTPMHGPQQIAGAIVADAEVVARFLAGPGVGCSPPSPPDRKGTRSRAARPRRAPR